MKNEIINKLSQLKDENDNKMLIKMRLGEIP